MSDQKRSSLRAFFSRSNTRKEKEPGRNFTDTPPSTSALSQGRLSAGLQLSPSSTSVPSANVAATIDPSSKDVSVGSLGPSAEHGDTISATDDGSKDRQVKFEQLWKEAIDSVKASKDGGKLAEVIQVHEQVSGKDAEITLPALMKRLETEMKRVGMHKKVAEAMEKVVPHLNRFAVVGDIAVSTNPSPAALPWAANLTANEEIRGKIVEGIAEITILVFEYSVYHELYLASSATTDLPINANLRRTIIDTISQCLRFLGFALRRQQATAKAFTDAFGLEDFTGYLKDLIVSKDKLYGAGLLCEMHHSSQSRNQLKSLHDLMIERRLESSERAEEKVKSQLGDLLIDPKDAFDHIYHPHGSFCLEGTRVQVLDDIEQWADNPSSPTICWLPGLAGTGKSTISRTIARNLKTRSLGASFFFKKGAGNRGNGRHLFSVLAYQLALHLPRILPYILEVVKEDHSLTMAPFQIQWQKLILNPLVKLQDEGLAKPIVFVLDVLDECDEQDRGEIFRLLLATCPGILKVFLTSRPELDIMGHFANEPLHREIVLHKLQVGTIESDFRVYLRHAMESFVTTVEIWDIDPLRHVNTFERKFSCLGERYYCLAISANGERLAMGSSDPGSVEIWDVKNAVLQHTLEVPLADFPCIAFSPGAAKIAYTLWKTIEVRCLPGLETLTITSEMYPGISFLRTLTFRGEQLIGIYMNTQVQVWDAATGECLFLSQPYLELRMFNLATNFLNADAIAHSGHGDTDDVLGTFYIGGDPAWLMKNGEKILWLPPDYRPESVYMSGMTMVLGTFSGRVLFLYLKE
ncbi:hypothetical protein LZL87_009938 [Fusarium oxysporum]|nr:hypothetical protein LZL87_009938 [Fusarium oxysporum]